MGINKLTGSGRKLRNFSGYVVYLSGAKQRRGYDNLSESGTFRPQTISSPSRFAPKTFPPWSFPP